ncbi:MAG: FtsQ-type POTRA domain-containing protein [Desulfomicrobium sp.]|jgi:cell division protein FtsQ|nr:FtsQ-type POTRA domain-containing protein [Desulfomicrobium sp.]NLV95735.1 FtsQ-type POTRA domain-containing protein [Desulfovibrionales bacterium]
MAVATIDRKIRRNAYRKTELCRPVSTVAVAGDLALGLGRVVVVILQWTVGLSVLVMISLGILLSYRWVTSHEFFRLEQLQIEGGQRLSSDEIAEMANIHPGLNLLEVNIADVQRQIAASHWVESVSVTRVLPNGLIVEIKEHQPFFMVRRGDRLFYADALGQPIAALSVEKFVALPLLDQEDGVPIGAGIHELFAEIARNTLPFGMQQIAWVRQDSPEQFTLFLEDPQVLIQVDGTDLPSTLTSLTKVWVDLAGRNELHKVKSIFAMPNRAWLKFYTEKML